MHTHTPLWSVKAEGGLLVVNDSQLFARQRWSCWTVGTKQMKCCSAQQLWEPESFSVDLRAVCSVPHTTLWGHASVSTATLWGHASSLGDWQHKSLHVIVTALCKVCFRWVHLHLFGVNMGSSFMIQHVTILLTVWQADQLMETSQTT